MFEPLQRMSGKAQWLAGARGLPESHAEELSGIWEKMGRNLPKLLFLTLTITAARGKCRPAEGWRAALPPRRCPRRVRDKSGRQRLQPRKKPDGASLLSLAPLTS